MKSRVLLVLVLALCCPAPLLAGAPVGQQGLAARMNLLESQTEALRAELQWLREHPVRLPSMPTAPASTSGALMAPEVEAEDYDTWEELRTEMKQLAWSKGNLQVVPYGFLWGNMVYETERSNPGSHTLYVFSADTHGEDNFVVDGRNTRLGLDLSGPRIPLFGYAIGGGKVEIDFQGDVSGTENRGGVLLRHAYCELKRDDLRLLAGQTWDVVSPLYPGTLMYSVGWGGGNIGYRRAQLRGEKHLAFSNWVSLSLQGSLNQNIFFDNRITNVRGEPSDWPLLEGRVGVMLGRRYGSWARPLTFGVSGHIGEQGFDLLDGDGNTVLDDVRRRTWSFNVDVRIPVTDRLGFQGEYFTGENLGTILGGALQGIDGGTLRGVRATGGWFELWCDWSAYLHSHVGYSIDDPNDNDVSTGRRYNQFYYGNLVYDVTDKFLIGVEVSSWKTLWVGQRPGDSVRIELVAKYGF